MVEVGRVGAEISEINIPVVGTHVDTQHEGK
jgi:hypothetical protein